MGWEVISLGSIDFKNSASYELIEDTVTKLSELEEVYMALPNLESRYITIEMGGNKGVRYDNFEKIVKEIKDHIYQVNLSEYSEVGDGFYYDPQEDEEDEE